ncbi:MAG TPA: hypothetical protein VFI42_15980 [Thermomicrobiaceae bacterium]|nr:hypothetical protein [Thermomicrobiaceae bacterium]
MTNVIATTSDGIEIEAGDWLVAGRGDSLDLGHVQEDGDVIWTGHREALRVDDLERAAVAIYSSRLAAEPAYQARGLTEAGGYSLTWRGGRGHTSVDHADHAGDADHCAECDAALAAVQADLPRGWAADWTGDGNGSELDVVIAEAV